MRRLAALRRFSAVVFRRLASAPAFRGLLCRSLQRSQHADQRDQANSKVSFHIYGFGYGLNTGGKSRAFRFEQGKEFYIVENDHLAVEGRLLPIQLFSARIKHSGTYMRLTFEFCRTHDNPRPTHAGTLHSSVRSPRILGPVQAEFYL